MSSSDNPGPSGSRPSPPRKTGLAAFGDFAGADTDNPGSGSSSPPNVESHDLKTSSAPEGESKASDSGSDVGAGGASSLSEPGNKDSKASSGSEGENKESASDPASKTSPSTGGGTKVPGNGNGNGNGDGNGSYTPTRQSVRAETAAKKVVEAAFVKRDEDKAASSTEPPETPIPSSAAPSLLDLNVSDFGSMSRKAFDDVMRDSYRQLLDSFNVNKNNMAKKLVDEVKTKEATVGRIQKDIDDDKKKSSEKTTAVKEGIKKLELELAEKREEFERIEEESARSIEAFNVDLSKATVEMDAARKQLNDFVLENF